MNQRGQVFIEFILSLLLVGIPLIMIMILCFDQEWNLSQCAFKSFFYARQELITTQAPVDHVHQCETVSEKTKLLPLEALDQNKGMLWFTDLTSEASRLSEDASSWLHSSHGQDSSDPYLKSD